MTIRVLLIFRGEFLSGKWHELELLGLIAAWLGLIIAWKWEGIGGALIISGVVIFHVEEHQLWLNWIFGLLGLVGILFMACWLSGYESYKSVVQNPAKKPLRNIREK